MEAEPQRATLADDFTVEGPGWDIPDHLLPVLLKAAEKRALDLAFDWPWVSWRRACGFSPMSVETSSGSPMSGSGTS